jgi:hypothetical protein
MPCSRSAKPAPLPVRPPRASPRRSRRRRNRAAACPRSRSARRAGESLARSRRSRNRRPWRRACRDRSQIGKALGQIGHRREQQLAVVERAQAHRDLRRIGIAFDDARALPFVEFAEPLGRHVGADEIGDAVERRADVDAVVDRARARSRRARDPWRCCARPSAIFFVVTTLQDKAPPCGRITRSVTDEGLARSPQRLRPLIRFATPPPARGEGEGRLCNPLADRRAHDPRAPARARRAARYPRARARAMICTPIGIGSPSVQTGTRDRQADEGDRLGEHADIGAHQHFAPSSTKVFWPSFGARVGVAGARMTSTSLEQLRAPARGYQRRNFCALTTRRPAASRRRSAGRARRDRNRRPRCAAGRDAAPRPRPW